MSPKPDYAELVRKVLMKHRFTQAELAGKVGVQQPMISLYLNRKQAPSSVTLEKIEGLAEGIEQSRFSEWVKTQRTRLKLTQKELAERAGLSLMAINFIETGKTESPQKHTVEAIERVLGSLPKEVESDISEESKGGFGDYLGPFPISEWKSHAKHTGGIYVFYDNDEAAVYVGKSTDIATRIGQHESEPWFKYYKKFAYFEVTDSELRNKMEISMIKLLGKHAIFNIHHKRT